jgi:hypothetical protein
MTRSCPLDYHHAAADLAGPAGLQAETLYVIGGLYGNPEALAAIERMRDAEAAAGRDVRLVFNGDFNWFNRDPESFRRINAAVRSHVAMRGNVEAELAREENAAGCGCNYPAYVDPGVVRRSDEIFAMLYETAGEFPQVRAWLAGLPGQLVAQVGGQRIAIVHGDGESLAGWQLAAEATAQWGATAAMAGVPQTSAARIADWFRAARVMAIACTHTCLAHACDMPVDGRSRLILNNGSAGMPNFRGDCRGLLTRISAHPTPPPDALYGCSLDGVRYDAVPIAYDHAAWRGRFERLWPPGSPAHVSYHERIVAGPAHELAQAARGRFAAAAGIAGQVGPADQLSTPGTASVKTGI